MPGVNFEIYNHQSGTFSLLSPHQLITLDTTFQKEWPEPHPNHDIYMVAPMYDIPNTMIAALKVLARNYPDAHAVVYQSDRAMQKIQAAQTGIKLIAEATLPQILPVDHEAGEQLTVTRLMAAGCVGALIDVDPKTLDAYTNDAVFLRRVIY